VLEQFSICKKVRTYELPQNIRAIWQKELWGHFTSGQPQYPRQNENEINLALSEAWAWLRAQGLIVPDMENGQCGWLQLSRRAYAMQSSGFQKLQGRQPSA
jgi:hypothetical protein